VASGREAAGCAAANAAQPNHRNAQSALLRPRHHRHGVIDRGNQSKVKCRAIRSKRKPGPRGPGLTDSMRVEGYI
jgi:hypothetical protein